MSVDASSPTPAAEPTRLESLSRAIAAALPEKMHAVVNHTRELTYETPAERLLEVAAVLRDAPHRHASFPRHSTRGRRSSATATRCEPN